MAQRKGLCSTGRIHFYCTKRGGGGGAVNVLCARSAACSHTRGAFPRWNRQYIFGYLWRRRKTPGKTCSNQPMDMEGFVFFRSNAPPLRNISLPLSASLAPLFRRFISLSLFSPLSYSLPSSSSVSLSMCSLSVLFKSLCYLCGPFVRLPCLSLSSVHQTLSVSLSVSFPHCSVSQLCSI